MLGGFGEGALLAYCSPRPSQSASTRWCGRTGSRTTWAPDYPWGADRDFVERSIKVTAEFWGTEEYGPAVADLSAEIDWGLPPSSSPRWADSRGTPRRPTSRS